MIRPPIRFRGRPKQEGVVDAMPITIHPSQMQPPVRPPGVSYSGRSAGSKFWGASGGKLVKMCPHVKPGGGVCGLEPKHCFCTCLLCCSLMHGRKHCNALMKDGTRCPWGADRSPDVSSPEQEPIVAPIPRRNRPKRDITSEIIAGEQPAAVSAVPGQDTQLARTMQQDKPPTWNRTASATASFSISSFNSALASKRAASPDLDDN